MPSTRPAMSTSTIRADEGSMRRNSDRKVLRTNTAIAPAISTPVGPAPTNTNVSNSRWRLGSSSASACSNARENLVSDGDRVGKALQARHNLANSLPPK